MSTSLLAGENPVPASRYRPDIDGLRAVAVMMVLGQHLALPHMSGGYIGVDIFFVISGYLITGIIDRELRKGKFSISRFYERRARRILPALIAMLLPTILAAYLIFPARQLVSFGYSLEAALFSYANLYFRTQGGYFSHSFTKVLQHTWSLGVEEQFYLLLPIAMALIVRYAPKALRSLMFLGWLASFAFAVWLTPRMPDDSFYLPFTRAWELISGGMLALGMLPTIRSRWIRELLAAAGLCTLFFCMAHYERNTVFPGLAALPVIIAATALIATGERPAEGPQTQTARWILENRVAVFLGMTSYSLYLWHWPILVILGLQVVHIPTVPHVSQRLLVALFCIAVGAASWKFIEAPFRTGSLKTVSRPVIFRWSGIALGSLALIGILFIHGDGLPSRFDPRAAAIGNYLEITQDMRYPCLVGKPEDHFAPECTSEVKGKTNILLLGDSHAAMYWYGLHQTYPSLNIMQVTGSGCMPRFPLRKADRRYCDAMWSNFLKEELPRLSPDAIIISGRWFTPSDVNGLEPLLKKLAEKKVPVYIFGPVPEFSVPLPLSLALAQQWNRKDLSAPKPAASTAALDQYAQNRFAGIPGLTYLSAYQTICGSAGCKYFADEKEGIPLLIDDNHLTNAASAWVVQRWADQGLLPFPEKQTATLSKTMQ